MKLQLPMATLCLLALLATARADNVTVHGTLGMLEAQLVTKDMEQVGTVQVWNDRNDMNVIVIPDAERCLLSKVWVYLCTESAPPPVPDWYEETLAEYEAQLAELEILLAENPEDPELLAQYAALLEMYEALLEEYLELYVAPDFGKWPFRVKFKPATPEPYSANLHLSELQYLQWGPWGMPWLDRRLITVAVRVELKTTDTVPVIFDAWALNPNVPVDLQRTSWGANALAMRYELQHPSHGQFAGPVHGIDYDTVTNIGTTGVDGGFWYYPEEYITFTIGDVVLGTAQTAKTVSPLNIFPGLEITDDAVVNMARLLLSLDADGNSNGPISITDVSAAALEQAMIDLGMSAIDFGNNDEMNALIATAVALGATADPPLVEVGAEDAAAWLEQSAGNSLMRRNISKSPDYEVDKPKLDIIPVWVPARTASGDPTLVEYHNTDGDVVEVRDKVKPLVVTYTEEQDPHVEAGITRRGSDIITAVSLDDGSTWKRFNVAHMARMSSFTLETGEKFPGNCRAPQQKIAEDKILVVWTSAYARGGKPSFAIKTDDDYPYDDPYAVNDVWGVRGRQGSVDYDEDKDVGDQGIGEIPYYALWACRGVLVWEGNASRFPDNELGDLIWFKPERLTSARRDAFFPMSSSAKNVGFAVAWQEDPGGLLPGSCMGGGEGWSGATVHKKTDIWYSFIKYADFDLIDENFVPADHSEDEQGGPDGHGQQPEIANRPKWLVPMALPVRISDNNTVNTQNMKVHLDPETGLPVIDPDTGEYIPLDGAIEEDYFATEHESSGSCEDGDDEGGEEGGSSGAGGGWGMARYAYMLPQLALADQSGGTAVWEKEVFGDYRPDPAIRWYSFVNKAGALKTVVVTADGRPLDGDTGACRPALTVMPGGWSILGYEETKGLGIPPEGEHGEDEDEDRPEPDDKGKNIIYHSFKFDQPDLVSAGTVLNLPALNDDEDLIPIFYKDAAGESTGIFRQYKTENSRRVRFIAQPKPWLGPSRTSLVVTYRQGREGNGKPSDVFAIRAVVPPGDPNSANPYRFSNLMRYETGAETSDPEVMKYQRRHMNMSAATVEAMDPVEKAEDGEGNSWNKVGKWKQYQGNLSDESFANPYSDAKAHRGFLRGDLFVFGYSFTPNWGRLGGDHMDFFVRRSFNGGQSFTTDPNGPEETIHTVIERDPDTGEYSEKQYRYGRGEFEPGRNVSLLKGNSHTVIDPRLVPPMGPGTVNPTYPEDDTAQDPNDPSNFTYYVAFGTADVLHGTGEPLGESDTERDDVYYSRTTDGGSTWYQVPWVINPNSPNPDAPETVYRWDWLAKGPPHQGHAQIRMHPSGTRLYAIWHQYTHGDEDHLSPHDLGNDIWFRRIDFME